MNAKFSFYECVRVVSSHHRLREIDHMNGVTMGMVKNENQTWVYSVHIIQREESWSVREEELVSNGRLMCRGDFYDGESI